MNESKRGFQALFEFDGPDFPYEILADGMHDPEEEPSSSMAVVKVELSSKRGHFSGLAECKTEKVSGVMIGVAAFPRWKVNPSVLLGFESA
jgi:hypothetical protein